MLSQLHPRLAAWFIESFGEPTDAQTQCVPHILAGRSVLLSSPTGSGKTLAGFLGVIDHLLRLHEAGELTDTVHALYVSPLRALTYDMQKNLTLPLQAMGLEGVIRVGMRTGDTTATERAKLKRKPPHILLTTPESLAILLPQEGHRDYLRGCRFVIVDELHALAENKRGSHLVLSLERLERLVAGGKWKGHPCPSQEGCEASSGSDVPSTLLPLADRESFAIQSVPKRGKDAPSTFLVRVGLSATAAPLPLLGRLLVGEGRTCEIVKAKVVRRRRVEVLSPLRKNPYPSSGWTATRVLTDIARLVSLKQSMIIFCNTRSTTESLAHRLKVALPDIASQIEAHHGSLDRDVRLEVEDRLKRGELRAVVCSTSLELGIDIGAVDCVVMISTPKGISRALQRIGRSGHSIREESHGVLVATNINDLMECIVCAEMTRREQLDEVKVLEAPLDVLAQHLVGMAMEGGYTRDAAWATTRRAHPFAKMQEAEFDRVLHYLKGGGRSLETQYTETFGKIIEVDGMLAVPSKKVEREYLANIGTIHSEGMVSVFLGKRRLGQVEEGFLKGLRLGDIFLLAGRMVRLVETGIAEAIVEDASGRLPTVPSWNAAKMPLASGLCHEVVHLRTELAERLKGDDDSVLDWLVETFSISISNAAAVVQHCRNQLRVSMIPHEKVVLIERFVDERDEEAGLVQFFFHTLIGRSANDALSRIVAQRVTEAVGGNAMVTIDDYGFLMVLKSFQDMGVEEWKELFKPEGAQESMRAALASSDLVKWQFRGVAQTGLMVPRNRPGHERKIKQLRWSGEILFRVLLEHEPDHPLLVQSYREATHTFLDLPGALEFLNRVQALDWQLVEVPVVAPFSFGIYASKIREGMMLEDPEEAIERLWREYERKVK
ncbi:MAG: associated domain protein [Verrucomicrobiaceae bacterium]|nr:associated domain protein [Verrucomicrobiaceae bacterium]